MPRILPKMRRGASIVGTVYTGMEVVESATHRAVDYIAVAIRCAAMNETIGFLLNDTARLCRRAFNARMRDSGITALQWRLISYLKRHEGIRQGPLAELIEVEPITLSRMIDRLAEAGLVERRADPTDRRAWQLYLTPRARTLLGDMRRTTDKVSEEATEGLSAAERDKLIALVGRVRCNLSRRDTTKEDEIGRAHV